MILFNSEPFLRELANHDFHLVLHGHKHFAGFQRLSYDLGSRGRRHLAVAAAGSASHPQRDDCRGHHFNLVEVLDDDTARVHSWFFSSASLRKDDSRVHVLRDLQDVRTSRFRVLMRQKGLTVDEVERRVIVRTEGYSKVEHRWLNCRPVLPSGVDGCDLEIDVHAPTYLRGVEPWLVRGSPSFLQLTPCPKHSLYRFRGRLSFGRSFLPGDPPFNLGFRCRMINSHALTAAEFTRKYFGSAPPFEYAALQCMDACNRLTLVVELPEGTDALSLEPDVEVRYMPRPLKTLSDFDPKKLRTHASESSRLRAETVANQIVLRCDSPVPGFVYRVRWRLPKRPDPTPPPSLASQVRVFAGQRRLLKLFRAAAKGDPSAQQRYQELRRILEALCGHLKSLLQVRPLEVLDLALLVFDEEGVVSQEEAASRKLRFVAATFSHPAKLDAECFAPGEGCAGYTFERGSYLLYHPRRDEIGYYIQRGERGGSNGLESQEFLVTMPWFYPNTPEKTSRVAVGVIALGSQTVDSALAGWFGLPEPEQRLKVGYMGYIQGLITEIANGILMSESAYESHPSVLGSEGE